LADVQCCRRHAACQLRCVFTRCVSMHVSGADVPMPMSVCMCMCMCTCIWWRW
jgi:hypothetical protein